MDGAKSPAAGSCRRKSSSCDPDDVASTTKPCSNSSSGPGPNSSSNSNSLPCPLCQETFSDRVERERHLSDTHQVTGDAMNRLLALADWKDALSRVEPSNDEENASDSEQCDEFKCNSCSASFSCVEDLASHQSDLGHLELRETPQGTGYVCWKAGCNQFFSTPDAVHSHFVEVHKNQQLSVSEKHVYKYRCNQCSLAFKTLEKLQLHSQYHLIREATTCSICGRTFRSVQAVLKHLESHTDVSEGEMTEARSKLMNNPLLQGGLSGQVLNPAVLELLKIEASKEDEEEQEDEGNEDVPQEQRMLEDYLNSQGIAEENYNDPGRKFKCHKCKVAFTRQNYLTSHNKTLLHRKGEKMNYPMEKYLDPNRPFKCDICKESFTQKNILLVHYNSVSHLHKLKRLKDAEASPPGNEDQQEEEEKPYKCNICKVAYSQGATLDVHIRSVLHQTRASKLHELALTGQIDLSVPLIEQPDVNSSGEASKNDEEDHGAPERPKLEPEGMCVSTLRRSSNVHKQLLQNFGFESVVAFLEYRQREPDMTRPTCPVCDRKFSSIWVLRCHAEEIHRDLVPLAVVERFTEEFRALYERRLQEEMAAGFKEEEEDVEMRETPTKRPEPHPMAPSMPNQQVNNAEMNAAALQQLQQLNPMVMASLGLGMPPFGMNMQALAAMNLQPPLVPFMMNAAQWGDPLSAALFGRPPQQNQAPPGVPQMDPANFLMSQQKMMQQQQSQPGPNNPPGGQQKRARTRITDDQLKILRAHFDINNSPSEEQIKDMARQSGLPPKVIKHWFRNTLFKERQRNKDSPYNFNNPPSTSLNLEEFESKGQEKKTEEKAVGKEEPPPLQQIPKQEAQLNEFKLDFGNMDSSQGPRSPSPARSDSNRASLSGPASPNRPKVSLGSVISNQLNAGGSSRPQFPASFTSLLSSGPTPPGSVSGHPAFGGSPVPMPPRSDGSLTPTGSQPYDMNSSSPSASSSGKRANRTRFTDYQIKVLQEFFENNAYPKDDDLEYLSKLLGLSPRVIVVWFQNARQKARKVYENQPPVDPNDEGAGRFQRTPGLNYQCKKCLLVFQRYYELIRHQKTHCFKEEDAKRSAQAQAAAAAVAAQAASSTGSEDSNSSSVNDSNMAFPSMASAFPGQQQQQQVASPKEEAYPCEHCNISFPRFDLWREHQVIHFMNPSLFSLFPGGPAPLTSPDSRPMSVLDSKVQQLREQATAVEDSAPSASTPTGQKRKAETEKEGQPEQHGKRLRTTILPEQLDYLYQKYQMESNPSRKALETIARDVGLKKRVVQVWFQNTRARERKGQYRAHAQVINKRCPFCPALFRVRSALETHLATKHPDQFSLEEINIDAIPDEEPLSNAGSSNNDRSSASPGAAKVDTGDLQKIYGESLKKYLSELETRAKEGMSLNKFGGGTSESPLDLSKPMDLTKPMASRPDLEDDLSSRGCDDTRSEFSEDLFDGDDFLDSSSPSSPMAGNLSHSSPKSGSNKRYRTQMSTTQVKVMKMVFDDYKTPTMTECETLGQEIGLPKRVIQVWFQNARAKAKKSRVSSSENDSDSVLPDECKVCSVKYSSKYAIQDHLFSREHLEACKAVVEGARAKSSANGACVTKMNFGLDSETSAEQLLAKLCSGALSSFPLGEAKFESPSFASATSAGEPFSPFLHLNYFFIQIFFWSLLIRKRVEYS